MMIRTRRAGTHRTQQTPVCFLRAANFGRCVEAHFARTEEDEPARPS